MEFFYHDLDHARFKIREDLISVGYACPDAYQSRDGEPPTTFDSDVGVHRVILPAVAPHIATASAQLRRLSHPRLELARELFQLFDHGDASVAPLAERILFEIVHEKSYPLDREIIGRELENDGHLTKLERKRASGFYGEDSFPPGNIRAARDWLFAEWSRL